VKKNSVWAFVDFNTAPDDLVDAENWVCSAFVESLGLYNPDFDIYAPANLKRVFAPEIQKFRKIYASVLASNQAAFDTRLADQMAEWVSSPRKFASAISRFVLGDQRKVLAVVFDNVDRRDREQQLRIFQIAQWFRSETRAFCLLALRDDLAIHDDQACAGLRLR
jgi:hypothetical protein